MTDLQSLIARVEAATGPSKEINRMIAKTQGWVRVEPRFMNNTRGGWIDPEDFIGLRSDGSPRFDIMHGTTVHQEVPAYTASLDAALTLVPEGYFWTVGKCGLTCHATVGPDVAHFDEAYLVKHQPVDVDIPNPSTPAIALCIAALRAKAAQSAIQGEGA